MRRSSIFQELFVREIQIQNYQWLSEWMNGILLLYISINILAAFCGIPETKLTYNQPTYFRGKPRERTDSWQTEFSTACKPIIETVRSWRNCNRRKSDPCLCFSMYHIFAGTCRVRDEDKVSWSRSIVLPTSTFSPTGPVQVQTPDYVAPYRYPLAWLLFQFQPWLRIADLLFER